MWKPFEPSSSASPTSTPSTLIKRSSSHTVPGEGIVSVSGGSSSKGALAIRSFPRSGYPDETALTSASWKASPTRRTLRKLKVLAVVKPNERALSTLASPIGSEECIKESAASNSAACMAMACSTRSVKNPTALTLPTATSNAAMRIRSSPACHSRVSIRIASARLLVRRGIMSAQPWWQRYVPDRARSPGHRVAQLPGHGSPATE